MVTQPGDLDLASEVDQMINNPSDYFHRSDKEVHSIPRDRLEAMKLLGLQQRFGELRDRVPILKKLADEQRVEEITELDNVVPLMFAHPMYKSYPISLLDKNKFGLLTKWLQKLTTVDLSEVDVSGCQGIDDWIGTNGRAHRAADPALLRHDRPSVLHPAHGARGRPAFLLLHGYRHLQPGRPPGADA